MGDISIVNGLINQLITGGHHLAVSNPMEIPHVSLLISTLQVYDRVIEELGAAGVTVAGRMVFRRFQHPQGCCRLYEPL